MKEFATAQKLRGGYYTPQPIADFLAEWAIQTASTTVLEPSCGDGNILESCVKALRGRKARGTAISKLVYGVELNEEEALKSKTRLKDLGVSVTDQIHQGDFFSYCRDCLFAQVRFDAIVGNPPFMRYQNFPDNLRTVAFSLMQQAGMKPSRLTNTWVPFLVASTLLLNEHGGRIGMVIPAELLQVNYAAELRKFLTDHYSKITLITFKKLVFEKIQQEVVLFLGEKNGNERTGIYTIELEDIDSLDKHMSAHLTEGDLKSVDHTKEKWTQYFLKQEEIDLLRQLRADSSVTLSGKVIDVDVGVVTGFNDFFILNAEQAAELGIEQYTKPIVTRSGHLSGIIFTSHDFDVNLSKQLQCLLLDAPNANRIDLPDAVHSYVLRGEENDVHLGYKCSIREKWYIVPSVWTPDAFMLRQIHGYPKLILNKTKATSTDTIHRVRFVSDVPKKLITAAFLNSLTFAHAEVVGRSYGGGVLELEPNEAEELLIPLINIDRLDVDQINTYTLKGDIESVLNITDRTLLIDGLGLHRREVELLRGIWYKLRDRRINRKHKKVSVDIAREREA